MNCEPLYWTLIQVPITVVHSKTLPLDGGAPLLLTAYGAYGECLDPDFAPERLSLLTSGWVLAFAHVRGGGELGRRCVIYKTVGVLRSGNDSDQN